MSTLETAVQPEIGTSVPFGYDKRMMVVAGRASRELGTKIADRLGIGLTDPGLKTFASGEVYCRYQESIRGADLFIVQSICHEEATGLTPNDALIELMLMIDAAKGASAHRVIAVTPLLGYTRQEKKSAPREPISARVVAQMLEGAGINRLLTMDLHAGQIQGFFSNPVDHMTAMRILTQYIQDQLAPPAELVIVSADIGRAKMASRFARAIGCDYAILEKDRPAQQVAEIGYVIGDVRGKTAVIVDDMIDTGGTLAAAAQTVVDEGAREVHAVATHGLFSGEAFATLERSPLAGIVVTDTVPMPDGAPDVVTQLTCADLLTQSIREIFTDGSVSQIFAGDNQLF